MKEPRIIEAATIAPEVRLQMIATIAAGLAANPGTDLAYQKRNKNVWLISTATEIADKIIWPDENNG